uniref:Uncharacterized protein n=1 Tax=Globodera rostochiensis TaxID=31243 RepID=A0A914HAE5_GLORO
MQLLAEEEAKRVETRAQLKDDNFLREMHSRLLPGIENSEVASKCTNSLSSPITDRRAHCRADLTLLTSSSGAKQILSQNESLFSMQRAMSHLAVAIATASEPSLKARHLEAVRMIFDQIAVAGSAQKQNSSAAAPDWEEQLLRRWFRWLGEPFPKLLLQCVRDPISEVQMGALRVLMALLRHQWAYPHFCAVNGFIDLLVDRSVANFDADALQLKHALVCRVVDAASPSVNAGQMELLRDYRVKGPFWLTPQMEVATEGAGGRICATID